MAIDVVDLDSVRAHLRYPVADTADDALLMTFIHAASDVMQREVGDSIPVQYDEWYDGGSTILWLRHSPLLSVETVEEGWGYATYVLDYVQSNSPPASTSLYAYSIDEPSVSQISRRSASNTPVPFVRGLANIHVVYTAGRNPIPDGIQFAAKELIRIWWQSSQQRVSGMTFSGYSPDAVMERESGSAAYLVGNLGVPFKIIELLKPYRTMPFFG